MLSFAGGTAMTVAEVMEQVRDAAQRQGVEGVTFLGGEPMAHAAGAAALAREARNAALSVMVFSGYTLAELRQMPDPAVSELLALTDILVDGPYLREQPETQRRWIGSANQQIHFLTDRYRADDPCWRLPNTVEIRLRGNELAVNGFPASRAIEFRRRS
jgi:anaerobic ribonucleoside-triphosphate reductase activating protein